MAEYCASTHPVLLYTVYGKLPTPFPLCELGYGQWDYWCFVDDTYLGVSEVLC